MRLSIVTLNYNTPKKTLACIDSVFAIYKNECLSGDFEHVILDNASSDNSLGEFIKVIKKKNYAHVKLIKNSQNVGFGKGCNIASAEIMSPYLLFLNSDTVVDNNGLPEMLKYLDKYPKVAVMGGKLINPDGSKQVSASPFYTLGVLLLVLLGFERLGLYKRSSSVPIKVDWVNGACMLVRNSIFKKLGGFDEQIFMYTEDMEFCFRVKQNNLLTYYFPGFAVIHNSHGSSNRSFAIRLIYLGILYFYDKHMPRWQYKIVKFLLRSKAKFLVIIGNIIKNKKLVQTYENAL